ncbi:unnamed protein product (macronuclear) [Paramecium tetraurelia]|uniref:Uncharacterized protein n=1 Tax=Paramecium tetraurelia TaxID=5888 RepID=A0DJ76_PARTE|nr:uncharacterized protein GSPATT00017450001 [Paramecium tetraurelia]CAK83093.1 unnamed protein product [Paramecium tetraurelia]|eukprot:XP_001450490.1 hypothetical protein (macronuclear) [Paramecium tetraurelia strain d4-2]
MQIDQMQHSTPIHGEETDIQKGKEVSLIVFPKKFLNPLSTYRMKGDFHLFADARHIRQHEMLKTGISCQNPYKKISKILVDQSAGVLKLCYTQLDFSETPWEYVAKRLQSFGDVQMNELSEYIKKYYEQLNSGLKQGEIEQVVHNILSTLFQVPPDNYRSFGTYQYKYLKGLNQFFISGLVLDIKLVEDLGYSVQYFVDSCMKIGIPEYKIYQLMPRISLQPGCSNVDYYKNVMEFAKPLTKPTEMQDFYLYSPLYPQGLKCDVSFSVTKDHCEAESDALINFNFYLNYQPSLRNNQALMPNKKLKSQNCISQYYELMDYHYSRCGFKKTKLN